MLLAHSCLATCSQLSLSTPVLLCISATDKFSSSRLRVEDASLYVVVWGAYLFTCGCVGRLSLYMWLCGAPISLHVVVWGSYLFTCGCVGRLSLHMWLCGAPISLHVVVWGAYLKFVNINANVKYDSPKTQHFISREHSTNVYVYVTCSLFGLSKFCIT